MVGFSILSYGKSHSVSTNTESSNNKANSKYTGLLQKKICSGKLKSNHIFIKMNRTPLGNDGVECTENTEFVDGRSVEA